MALELQHKMQMDIYSAHVKNELEIQKKQALNGMSVSSKVELAMSLADVAAERELQKTSVAFTDGGGVILQKERFGNDLKGRLPIKILNAKLFSHINDVQASVLSVIIKKDNDNECFLFWNLQKTEIRWIRQPFEKNGISFGFGEKKENEIRRKLLLALVNNAKTVVLPEHHGWYQVAGKWQYAFPGDLTWEEVNARC